MASVSYMHIKMPWLFSELCHMSWPPLRAWWETMPWMPFIHKEGKILLTYTMYTRPQTSTVKLVKPKLHGWSLRPGIGCQYFSFFVYKGHSWHCFPSVPWIEFMTCDTVQKRAMASWYVADTSHENKHPVEVGSSTSDILSKGPQIYRVRQGTQ